MKSGTKSRKSTAKRKDSRRSLPRDLNELVQDEALISAAVSKRVREAVLAHKAAGRPTVICRDGKIVHVPPEDIEFDENGSLKEK